MMREGKKRAAVLNVTVEMKGDDLLLDGKFNIPYDLSAGGEESKMQLASLRNTVNGALLTLVGQLDRILGDARIWEKKAPAKKKEKVR